MQPRSARALHADLHRSSGAKERRHQDDNVLPQQHVHPSQTSSSLGRRERKRYSFAYPTSSSSGGAPACAFSPYS
jgi:hypothetical protein